MQRYAHMRRSNVERAFQIHFDDWCYVCQTHNKSIVEEEPIVDHKKRGCLLSGIDEQRGGAHRCGCGG